MHLPYPLQQGMRERRSLPEEVSAVSNELTVMRKAVIPHAQGLNARAASLLAATANQFSAEVVVKYGGSVVNGKSLLGLMSLGAPHGAVVTIVAEGPDAGQTVSTLEAMLQSASD